jgi:predicted nucleotidyltransferase component of viral defense system
VGMIPLAEINAAANKFRIPVETIEKDYVISWILFCLSKSKLRDDFIFYGGTALKRVYFEEHRFSEDIDLLSYHHFPQDYLLQGLDILQYAREEANLVLEVNRANIIASKDRVQLLVRYSGYEEITGVPKEVRIDFAMGMHSYGETKDNKIIKSYSDLNIQDETLSVMTLNTILANKLGLLMDLTRNEPRDLFDVWFLLQRAKEFDFDFDRVCKAFSEKYGFYPSLSILKPCLQNHFLKIHWDTRLRKQITELCDIEIVIKDILNDLKKLFSHQ